MTERRPAYQRYARDELAGAIGLSLEELGALTRLQDLSWLDGSIPADPAALAKVCSVPRARMLRIWEAIGHRFQRHPTLVHRLIYPPLEAYRRELADYQDRRSAAGKEANRVRWERDRQLRSASDSESERSPNAVRFDPSASATASAPASSTDDLQSSVVVTPSLVERAAVEAAALTARNNDAAGGWEVVMAKVFRRRIGRITSSECREHLEEAVREHGATKVLRALAEWTVEAPRTEKPQFLTLKSFARQVGVWIQRTEPIPTYDENNEMHPDFARALGRSVPR